MVDRRHFALRAAGALGALALPVRAALSEELRGLLTLSSGVERALDDASGLTPDALAEDETFWAEIRRSYTLRGDVVNLDHGWTNPTPTSAIDELTRGMRQLEGLPAEELPRMWYEITNRTVRSALAQVMGVPGSELALVRNATEALDTVLLGMPLNAGDEVVCSAHDYYAMLDALEQRRARDGVVLRMIQPSVPAPSMNAIAAMYEAMIGPRTRLVLLTHPSNITGQLLPVERIAAAAHRAGAEVVVDGAQSLGLFEAPVSELGCDYYGASTHKWLGTPVGMGVLWMRPEHTRKIWPLIPSSSQTTGMERYEAIGTSATYIEPAALPALALHRSLGAPRKLARLRYLSERLRTSLEAALPAATFYTIDPLMAAGLTTIALPGVDMDTAQKRLRERHSILTQAMTASRQAPDINGLRVSPNVYTSLAELDQLVIALRSIV
ncbi:MAG: aminotransferase class V-fold PLP-dependent enzyme [Gammaproteobacteria bacterium]